MHKRWGWMLTLLQGKRFKIKALFFEKDKQISLQKHKHRNELWLCVFGNGDLYNQDELILLKKGEWTNIVVNEWHHFKADKPTLIIEIQYGNKCSERDIERK